jgi:hypothetical protein
MGNDDRVGRQGVEGIAELGCNRPPVERFEALDARAGESAARAEQGLQSAIFLSQL